MLPGVLAAMGAPSAAAAQPRRAPPTARPPAATPAAAAQPAAQQEALVDPTLADARRAYTEGTEQLIAHVASVDFGDIIHLYFAATTSGSLLGAFRVVGPNKHPNPEYFGKAVHKTKLRTVADGPLRDHLVANEGYTPDSTLKLYCGWPVVAEEVRSPSYIKEMFPGRNALVKR